MYAPPSFHQCSHPWFANALLIDSIVPTVLLPLRLLSLPSLLSSISSFFLIIVLLVDGILPSPEPSSASTGSLLHPSPTSLSPEWSRGNWLGGIGLILAGFGGHAVMPSLARDMKRPEKFDGIVNWAFVSFAIVSSYPLSNSV